ncbi:hypothetical protein SAMN05421595_1838 [Austwickia chelonae]|uniref:DUF4124 domain-containing protein n=1 Tax=Austwickia chelonae NBRC 105200 TaxID=1184607 RepID=K6UKU8_9MICO|nr:hypothetical protein [Austwickia chelonae]GAB76706.1 hypothetical protein AUCHE_02_00670 [Austwickia chelonae NBRC 105200]SEW29575.1 hypothetical protein SAMN05421595_1838 [Austwickia chelonae]
MRLAPHRHTRSVLAIALMAPLTIALAAPATAAPGNPEAPRPTPGQGVDFQNNTDPGRTMARRQIPPRTPNPAPEKPGRAPGRLLNFSPDSFFYDDISSAPLDPNSAAIGASVATQVAEHWGGIAAFNAHAWNSTFYRVDANTPRVRVKWSNCFKWNWTPKNLYDGRKVFVDVPIPSYATSAPGSDGAMSIYDPATDTSWEFWQMKKDASGDWQSCQGGRIDKVSKAAGQYPLGFGVSAAGISMTGGMISAEEIRRGRIDHAMYLAVVQARHFTEYSWPAVRSDGYTKDPNLPLEGQRLRLDPTLDVDSLNITPFAKTVAKAAQKYGFIVSDKGGAVALIGESGQSLKATTGTDPWPQLLGGSDHEALRGFPWNRLQALPKDYGKR